MHLEGALKKATQSTPSLEKKGVKRIILQDGVLIYKIRTKCDYPALQIIERM